MTEMLGVELASPGGEVLRLEWDEAKLGALKASVEAASPGWRLSGELDWDEIELVRVISGRFEDERMLTVAGLRPAGADGHAGEILAGWLGGGERLESEAILLSTEYGPDGLPRRIGLELRTGEEGLPLRMAGDVERAESEQGGDLRHVRADLQLRLDGTSGAGVYEILTRA